MPSFKTILLLFTCFLFIQSTQPVKTKSPNIILIFMDDLGYGDLSCYGASDYRTENIDKLASEGIRFTNFLAAQAVCSASRAALLTGCYPNRIGISGALMPYSKKGIHDAEKTMAEMLKEQGYATGIFGKWHLGHQEKFLPLQHGFDEYLGLPYSNDMWPVFFDGGKSPEKHYKNQYPTLPLIEGNQKKEEILSLKDQERLTTLYTERAVQFINKNKKKPFFLYLPHSMPHVPIAVSEKFAGKSKKGLYADLMLEIDWSVGEIMKSLKANGLDKNTLVIFTSDNGPWLNFGNHAGSSGGLREGKGTSFEGGQRVPCIMRWAGTTPSGVVCNQLSSTIDVFPTIAQLTGGKLPNHTIDGVDMSAILKGDLANSPRKTFYYYYRKNALEAVRMDNWKLVLPHEGRSYLNQQPGQDGFPGNAPENIKFPMALYDLRRDPAEQYDVQAQNPAIVEQLLALAETAREDLGDEIKNRIGKNVRASGVVE